MRRLIPVEPEAMIDAFGGGVLPVRLLATVLRRLAWLVFGIENGR